MPFYEASKGSHNSPKLKQGDLLWPVPFLGFSLEKANIFFPEDNQYKIVDLSEGTDLAKGSQIFANIEKGFGVVLNQTCDLIQYPSKKKPIIVARVVKCEERLEKFPTADTRKRVNFIKQLSNSGQMPTIFYLPEYEDTQVKLPMSVIDLLEVACFSPLEFNALSNLVKLRLSSTALQALQERLAYCFGRVALPEDFYFSDEEKAVFATIKK